MTVLTFRRTGQALLMSGIAGVAGALIVWPLSELGVVAAELSDVSALVDESWSVIRNTLIVGVATAGLAVALGLAGAIVTERTAVYGRRWLRFGFVLPVLVPPFVSALSWLRAYGPSGLSDDLLGFSMPGIFGPVGVIAVVAVNAMPITYVLIAAALRSRAGRDLELAARISGAGPLTVARTVTLPMLRPSLLGSAALAFVIGINAFGVPAILGTPASFETVTTRIFQNLTRSARPESFSTAVFLATGLVAVAFVFVAFAETVVNKPGALESEAGPTGTSIPEGRQNLLPSLLAWIGIIATTILPVIALVLVSVTRGVGLSPTPANWTLGNFGEAMDTRLWGALGRSLLLAGTAATVVMLLGSAVAGLRPRFSGRLAGVIVLLGFAIPGSTLGVAMILGYGSVLRDTVLLILFAYIAKLWAVGHRTVAASLGNVAPEMRHAARISGAGAIETVKSIVAPVVRPALAGGWALAFLIAFHELTMSSLLYGPGTETLAVTILNVQQLGDVPVSSALAVLITVPLVLIVVATLIATGRRARKAAAR